MELAEMALNILISILSVSISATIIAKLTWNRMKNDVKDELLSWIQTEQAAKLFYQVGAVIGNGAKAGFGLDKGKGKFSIEGLIGEIAGNWIQSKMGTNNSTSQPSSSSGKPLYPQP